MKKGFTLIELLVVVTIIGVLASLLLVAFQGTRQSARDGKRKAELEQIRVALEMYRSDCGEYPSSLSFGSSLAGNGSGGCLATNVYMEAIPQDPLSPAYGYRYLRDVTNTSKYTLCAYLETGSGVVNDCGVNCVGANCNYKVNNR